MRYARPLPTDPRGIDPRPVRPASRPGAPAPDPRRAGTPALGQEYLPPGWVPTRRGNGVKRPVLEEPVALPNPWLTGGLPQLSDAETPLRIPDPRQVAAVKAALLSGDPRAVGLAALSPGGAGPDAVNVKRAPAGPPRRLEGAELERAWAAFAARARFASAEAMEGARADFFARGGLPRGS